MNEIEKIANDMLSEKYHYCYELVKQIFDNKSIETSKYKVSPPKIYVSFYGNRVKVKITYIFMFKGELMFSFQIGGTYINERILTLDKNEKNIILNYILKVTRGLKQKCTYAMIKNELSNIEIPIRKTAFGKIVTIEEFRDRVENSILCSFIDYYLPNEIISKEKFYEMNDYDFNLAINEFIIKERIK